MSDFNYIEIERKEYIERFDKFIKGVGFVPSFSLMSVFKPLRHEPTNAYVCFIVGAKGSGKTNLADQMLNFLKEKRNWSWNIPIAIVEVDGVLNSKTTEREYGDRLKIYEEIRASFRRDYPAGSFQHYDQKDKTKQEIEGNLNKYIIERFATIKDENKKEIQEAVAKGITPLMGALIAWITGNPSMALTFALFQDLVNKIAIAGLDLATEKFFSFYQDWKSQNEKDHNALRNYYKDARENFHRDIRELSRHQDVKLTIRVDNVEAMGDCTKNLGDIIKVTSGGALWILVGKKGKLLALGKEWSSFIVSETIEVEPFTCDEIKARMLKSNDLDDVSQVDIEKTANAIFKYTTGNPDLVRDCIDLWDKSDAKSKRSFKSHFVGKKSKGITSIIEVKLEALKASGEREIGFINMLLFLGILSGNIGNLLYRNRRFDNVENEILSAIGGETYGRIQKDGFIYRTESGRYALQHIWNSYLIILLENAPFRKNYKHLINNVNRTAIHCLTEEQYKIVDKDAQLHEKVKHETWIRFEFARCYHKLWCDEEEAWRDIIKTLAVTWMYQPKLYPDFVSVIQEVSEIIHEIHRDDLNALQTLATKNPKKQKAYQVFKKYAGSDPDILEIIGKLNKDKRFARNVGDSINIMKSDADTSKDGDGERKDNKKSLVSDQDIFLISLAEIGEHIKNKEYGVAKEKIKRVWKDSSNQYQNRFSCKLGECYLGEGAFDKAGDEYEKIYSEVFADQEKDYIACLWLGWGFHAIYLYAQKEMWTDAPAWLEKTEVCFERAIEHSNKKYEPRMERASLRKQQLLWDDAVSDYLDVARHSLTPPEIASAAWEGAGEICIMLNRYGRAIEYYNEAYKLTPNSHNILLNRAYLYCKYNDKDMARGCIGKIRNRDLELYVIAEIEALEFWINESDLDANSSVIKRLGELFASDSTIIKRIEKDRFFEYICSQAKYANLIRKAAIEAVKDDNSNLEPML